MGKGWLWRPGKVLHLENESVEKNMDKLKKIVDAPY